MDLSIWMLWTFFMQHIICPYTRASINFDKEQQVVFQYWVENHYFWKSDVPVVFF